MMLTPVSSHPAVRRLAVNPRMIDWSQLRYRLIWAYSGRPSPRERSAGEPGLTAWRINQGRVVLCLPGGSTTVAAGQWVLLPASGAEATFSPDAEIVSVRMHASWPDGRILFDPARPLVTTALQGECLAPAARELVRFVRQRVSVLGDVEAETADLATFLELNARVAEWLKAYASAAIALGHQPNRIGLVDARALAARQHLDAAPLESPLEITPLLRAVGLSRKQIDRVLVAETGHSLQRYFDARRLDFALLALRTLPLTIKEISGRVGFAETAAFSHWIRRNTGRSPSEWRQFEGSRLPEPYAISAAAPLRAACA
jgi:AraC-like DNA-binding protein